MQVCLYQSADQRRYVFVIEFFVFPVELLNDADDGDALFF
jgi:hypothetical protein